jgi:hypothetical protein
MLLWEKQDDFSTLAYEEAQFEYCFKEENIMSSVSTKFHRRDSSW